MVKLLSMLSHLHLPTVLIASAAVLGLVSVSLTLFARHHRQHMGAQAGGVQGMSWWIGAQWLATLGVASLYWYEQFEWLAPISSLLLLQWPAAVLIGLRRFHPRAQLPGSIPGDVFALFACMLAWTITAVSPLPDATPAMVLSMSMGLLHLWAAHVLSKVPTDRRTSPLHTLRILLIVGAAMLVIPIMIGFGLSGESTPALAAIVLPLALDSMAVLCVCMVLTHERAAQTLRDAQVQLQTLANVDSLTSMPNRRHFQELASAMVAKTSATPTVMMFDIDHFKQVNDKHGHAVGDQALQIIADSARHSVRACDIVARLGGDEFVVMLPSTSHAEALRAADRMVRYSRYLRRDHPEVPRLGMSFGVVTMQHGETLESCLRRADEALYEAKRQGRCRAVAADTQHDGSSVFAESQPLGLDGVS